MLRIVVLLLSGSFPLLFLHADDPKPLQVEVVFSRSVEDRQPTGEDTLFSSDVGKVYCWTLVTGALESTTITHKWFWGQTDMASIDLEVDSPRWRTWSSKTILPEWTGRWSVTILDARGHPLASSTFSVLPAQK